MYITQAEFRAAYERIGEAAAEAKGCTVLLLVAADADAIAAARILTMLLKGDNIEFKLVAVSGYSEVEKEITSAASSVPSQLRSVVMLNCGATSKLDALLPEPLPVNVSLYIIDCHSPPYHTNVRDKNQILVFGWRPLDNAVVPEPGDSDVENDDEFYEGEDDEEESDEDESDGGDDDKSGSDSNSDRNSGSEGHDSDGSDPKAHRRLKKAADTTPQRKRKHRRAAADGDDEDAEEAEDSADDNLDPSTSAAVSGRKRRRPLQSPERGRGEVRSDESEGEEGDDGESRRRKSPGRASKRRQFEDDDPRDRAAEKKRRLQRLRYKAYYSGHSYTHPASLICYELAEQLNKGRNDLLWLAIVGVTDHFLQEHISAETYGEYYKYLKLAVLSRNSDSRPYDMEADKIVSAGKGGYVALSEEPRFAVHRFWTMYNAMCYSDYVATRLDTWKDEASGRSNLDKLFALAGLHTKTASQNWQYVSGEDRRLLFTKLHEIAEEKLGDPMELPLRGDMFYPSFTRIVDMENELSAADVCAAINGLLSAGTAPPAALEPVKDTLGTEALTASSGAGAMAGSSLNVYGAPGAGTSVLSAWSGHTWKEAFLEAYECIAQRGTNEGFLKGIHAFQLMKMSMLRLGNALVRGNHVVSGRLTVQISLDEDMNDNERRVFTQPIALAALGRYLIKLYRDGFGKWRSKAGHILQRPVVITVAHPYTSGGKRWLTVMGLPVTDTIEDAAATTFLDAFQQAAGRAGAEYLMDSFDSATLLLDAEHRNRFFELLDAVN